MVIELKTIVDKYKTDEDIVTETETNLENVLDFDRHGRYDFVHCGTCGGPVLGHKPEKCRQLDNVRYDDVLIKAFEDKIKTIDGFRKVVKKYMEQEEEKENRRKAKEIEASVRAVLENFERKEAGNTNQTTQLVKSRFPPIWSGQTFDRWKVEVEKWSNKNKASDEDKYVDLFESLKKNDAIKDYVNRTLIEKVGDDRTVKKVLEIMNEKFSKTKGEKILDLMKKISDFRTEENIETLIDRFEEMITETDKTDLATNLRYALSVQFVDRLEKSSKINAGEKLRLKDVIEDNDGEPRVGDIPGYLKKELRKIKVEDNREEVFARDKEYKTNYVRNGDNRSRYNNWKNSLESKGYVRSRSNPKFFRTNSKGTYKRDNSKFGRSMSKSSQSRDRGRSNERPKSELFKKVEEIEKKMEKVDRMEKSVGEMMEMLKRNPINMKYVEEEIIIDVKFVDTNIGQRMIVDSGAPLSIISSNWLEKYIKEAKVDDNEMNYKNCVRRFRLGKTLYISTSEVTFPIVMKVEGNDYVRREITANIIDSDEVTFLCGQKTLTDWKTALYFAEQKLKFTEKGKSTGLNLSEGGHMLVNLERVGEWTDEDSICFVKKENDVTTLKAITKIHKILNHKKIEQMEYAYRNAGKLNTDIRRMIRDVVENCEICKQNARSKSKPVVAISRATDFNSVIAIDLKQVGKEHILWMICGFTRFIKGIVLKNKIPESVMKGLHSGWCMNFGFPTVGFYADNGGEFQNYKVDEFTNKLGLRIEFGPSYSPWSNGMNERNHYSCDVIVKKIIQEDKKVTLQDAVDMASWTHNTNVNTLGFTPMQLVTGKSVVFPGISTGNIATESLYDDEMVRSIMERHRVIMKEFREQEFSRKLDIASKTRSRGYEDEIVKEEDLVFYQVEKKKAWLGPVKIFAIKGNSVFLFANGSMRKIPRCNVKLCKRREEESDFPHIHPLRRSQVVSQPGNCAGGNDTPEVRKEKVDFVDNEDEKVDFGDNIEEDDVKEFDRMRTRSMERKKREELEKDNISTFWLTVENNECYDDIAVYAVEVPTKEHKRMEVVEAKEKELQNLFNYDVFEEVEDKGQERIGSRWVITQKEKADGQKTVFKGRLVARGFQEKESPQSDSPTMLRESMKLFFAVAANEGFKLRSIDIRAAFLQAKSLDREVYLEPPKDVKKEGKLWLLKKPLYGLNDASRKFWLKVKKVFEEIGLKRLDGDEAYYYKHNEKGDLEGMISSHVDDFNLAGNEEFIEMVTEKIKNALDISKIEDGEFRFTGIDVKEKDGRIELSMEDYAKSLEIVKIRDGKQDELLTREEMRVLRKYVGKINWLAANTRPDIAIYALDLAKKQKKATLKDLRDVNRILKKVSEKESKVIFGKITGKDDLCVVGISDASYNQEGHSVAGEMILLGSKNTEVAAPMYWKSGIIRKICTSPKAAETRAVMKLVDDSSNMSRQLSILMNRKISLRVFTDSRPLLESIGSSSQIAEKALRQSIASMKQSLEDGDVDQFSWIEGKEIVADVFTKQGSKREALDEIVKENCFRHAQNKDNLVVCENEEITIKNLTTKEMKA